MGESIRHTLQLLTVAVVLLNPASTARAAGPARVPVDSTRVIARAPAHAPSME